MPKAKVVEAFCHAACRLSNQCRPSIHEPPVDEFRTPACAHARRLVLAPRPPSRSPPTYDPHSTRLHCRVPYSRDFVHWRFSDAGRRSAWIASSCRRPKTCTRADSCIAANDSLFYHLVGVGGQRTEAIHYYPRNALISSKKRGKAGSSSRMR
jgi:hypothetical protein